MTTLAALNATSRCDAIELFRGCCGSSRWSDGMTTRRPFADVTAMHAAADEEFKKLSNADWLEAFESHPKLGDLQSLRMKYAGNDQWSSGEQAGVTSAAESTLTALAEGNAAYETRFGHLFILCASGLSAAQMLAALEARLPNPPDLERTIAASEQAKITHLRIDKLCETTNGTP